MLNREHIDLILKDSEEIPPLALKLKNYTFDILNYKPGQGWSAAECLDHLILINQKYIAPFEEIRRLYTGTGDKRFRNSFIGKFIVKSVHPDAARKVKTFSSFNPVRSSIDAAIVDEYLQQHYILRKFIENFREYDLMKIKVSSPMSSIVKYNLGDACSIIINHDLRHLKQAHRAAETYFKIYNEA